MLTKPLGDRTWNTDGISICFAGNDAFLSLDENKGIERFSLATGHGEVVWKSEYECLSDILPTGQDRYFVGGSYGIGYNLRVMPGGEWRVENKRELLDSFDAAGFAEEKKLLAVCWYHLVRQIPLDGDGSSVAIECMLNKCRVFSVEWVTGLEEFLTVSPKGLFLISTTGSVRQLATLKGEVLAAVNIGSTGQFVCALGVGETVTVYMARYDDPQRPIWKTEFVQRPPSTTDYNSRFLSMSKVACLVFESTRNDLFLTFVASIRRITLSGEVTQTVQLPFSTHSLCISPDAEHVVVGTIVKTYVLNRRGEFIKPRTCYGNRVSKFVFSADESKLLSQGFASPEVFCWDVRNTARLWEFWSACDWVRELFQDENQKTLIIRDGFEVDGDVLCELDDQGQERILFKLNGHDSRAVLLDRARVAVALTHFGKDYDLEVRELPSGKLLSVTAISKFPVLHLARHQNLVCVHDRFHLWIIDVTKPKKGRELTVPTKDVDLAVYFENASSLIVVSRTGVFRTGLTQSDWKTVVSFPVSATVCGEVVNGRIPIGFEDGTLEIRSASDFSVNRSERVEFEGSKISACTLSPSGYTLAVGAADGRMVLCYLD